MKCPNCGEEIAEGRLYCERCGEDIHIVPDFEPELDQTILDILGEVRAGIADGTDIADGADIADEAGNADRTGTSDGADAVGGTGRAGETEGSGRDIRQEAAGKKRAWKWAAALLLLAVLAAGAAAWHVYGYYSESYQLSRAAQYVELGRYDEALACYSRALELDQANVELLFDMADIYLLKNNKIEYEYLLREIIRNTAATSEQLEGAYGKLIAIYRDRKDYQTINALLLASGNETLIAMYPGYVVEVPEFSVNEGYYTSIQPLKLTAAGSGRIYYTTDGSDPTQESAQYTAPIILENGIHVVKAIFVSDNGIASDVAKKEYHIEYNEIPPPEISVISGEYYVPTRIEVISDDEDVYYTTDGSDPTYSSIAYTGAIHMPLGKSIFKFAKIEEGVTGTIAEREYNLVMSTEFTPEQAVASVVEYALGTGKILDAEGHFDASGNVYRYEYQYVRNINRVSDFYVIAEIYRTAEGSVTRTGNNFAVDAYTGKRYKLQRDDKGRLSLIEIETEIDEGTGG